MKDPLRFIFIILVSGVFIFAQGTRFLSANGINPNLVFIFFSGLLFVPSFRKRVQFSYLISIVALSFFIGLFLFSFWVLPWMALAVLILAIYFLRDFLTGHPFPDFLLTVGIGTFVFYGLLKILTGGVWGWGLVLSELIYNLVLGIVFWFPISFLGKYEGSRS